MPEKFNSSSSLVLIILLILTLVCLLSLWPKEQITENSFDLSQILENLPDHSLPLPDASLRFPKDHGPHPESRIENWSFAGVLQAENGQRFGFQLNFWQFKSGSNQADRLSSWATQHIYLSHLNLTLENSENTLSFIRISRDGPELAGFDASQHKLWLYDWSATFKLLADETSAINLQAKDDNTQLQLSLKPLKPVVEMTESKQFRLYSLTRMAAQGKIQVNGEVFTVSGAAFFNHLWGNMLPQKGQIAWNRFILQLSDDQELIIFQSRRKDGTGKPVHNAYFVSQQAIIKTIEHDELEVSILRYWEHPITGERYPLTWRIQVPGQNLDITIQPLIDNQVTTSIIRHWNGMILVTGKSQNHPVHGSGQMILTGYDAPAARN